MTEQEALTLALYNDLPLPPGSLSLAPSVNMNYHFEHDPDAQVSYAVPAGTQARFEHEPAWQWTKERGWYEVRP